PGAAVALGQARRARGLAEHHGQAELRRVDPERLVRWFAQNLAARPDEPPGEDAGRKLGELVGFEGLEVSFPYPRRPCHLLEGDPPDLATLAEIRANGRHGQPVVECSRPGQEKSMREGV